MAENVTAENAQPETDDAALLRRLTELTLAGVLKWNGSDRDGFWCQPAGFGRTFELTAKPDCMGFWWLLVRRDGCSAGAAATVKAGWWGSNSGLMKAVRASAAAARVGEVRESLEWLEWLNGRHR